jgi:hypothetical protein
MYQDIQFLRHVSIFQTMNLHVSTLKTHTVHKWASCHRTAELLVDKYCDMVHPSVPIIVKPALTHSDARHVIRVDVIHTLWLDDWSLVTQLPGGTKYTFTTFRIVSFPRTVGNQQIKCQNWSNETEARGISRSILLELYLSWTPALGNISWCSAAFTPFERTLFTADRPLWL